jgi:ubiquinone/menaquinone biosynthesis C-methylase UbiE
MPFAAPTGWRLSIAHSGIFDQSNCRVPEHNLRPPATACSEDEMDKNNAAFVGSIPDFYDRGLGPVIFEDFAGEMARRVAARLPSLVLETAAGTGIVTAALRRQLPATTHITATDLNPPMLEIARNKPGLGQGVAFQTVDAQQLPFPDASFDALVCQFGIMFFPDRPASFREALRVLRPGGTYHFSVWDAQRYNTFARITDTLVKTTFPIDPPLFYAVPFSCASIDPIKQMLLDAGFGDIQISVTTLRKRVEDLEMFSRGLIFGNPLFDQIRSRGGTTPERMQAEVLELLIREFGAGPSIVPLQTIFYDAMKPAA